jgi:hypothetical protein
MAGKTSKKSAKAAKKATAKRGVAKPTLTGGNPQIAKADGDAPVQAYIAGMPGSKRASGAASTRSSCAPSPACARRSNGTRRCTESMAKAGSSASIASRSTSRWLSFAAHRCVLSPPASPRTSTRATSTSTRTTSPTRSSWRVGLGRHRSCPAGSRSAGTDLHKQSPVFGLTQETEGTERTS